MAASDGQRAERFQGYGVVLLLDATDLTVRHASSSCEIVLGTGAADLVGTAFADLLAPADRDTVLRHLPGEAAAMGWQRIRLKDERYVKIHGFEPGPGLVGLDLILQPPQAVTSGAQAVERVAQWTERLLSTTDVIELMQLATSTVTALTGFEGAWACSIEPDGHAVVIAATAPNTSDVSGQFVPATDIPPSEPLLRGRPVPFFVTDLAEDPAELMPAVPGMIEVANSTLHRPYEDYLARLHDIGVRSTLSVPVVVDGSVYARLIAHDPTVLQVAPAVQAELRLLGAATSTHLSELLRLQETRERLDRATWSSRILKAIADAGDLSTGLLADPDALLGLCSATAALVSIADDHRQVGATVPEARRDEILASAREALTGGSGETVHVSSSRAMPGSGPLQPVVTEDFLAVRLGRESDSLVVWIRHGERQSVTWVDHVAVDGDAPATLFGAMGELVAEEPSASPWSAAQVQAVADFHAALANLIMARYQEVALLNEQLARSNAEFDAFAHAAAHDLKQPIRGIRQYTEFFLEDVGEKLTEDERRQLGTVLRLTGRMTDLLDGLMRYAELSDPTWPTQPIALRAAVDRAVELLPPSVVEEAAIDVQDATLTTDRAALDQLLLNLIGNALKYRGDGPASVSVGLTTLGGTASVVELPELLRDAEPSTPVLFVTDRGIGIDERHQQNVFGLFRQVDPDTPGSGAGLAICRRIARRQGGDIWLSSVVGEGSTFYVVVGG